MKGPWNLGRKLTTADFMPNAPLDDGTVHWTHFVQTVWIAGVALLVRLALEVSGCAQRHFWSSALAASVPAPMVQAAATFQAMGSEMMRQQRSHGQTPRCCSRAAQATVLKALRKAMSGPKGARGRAKSVFDNLYVVIWSVATEVRAQDQGPRHRSGSIARVPHSTPSPQPLLLACPCRFWPST